MGETGGPGPGKREPRTANGRNHTQGRRTMQPRFQDNQHLQRVVPTDYPGQGVAQLRHPHGCRHGRGRHYHLQRGLRTLPATALECSAADGKRRFSLCPHSTGILDSRVRRMPWNQQRNHTFATHPTAKKNTSKLFRPGSGCGHFGRRKSFETLNCNASFYNHLIINIYF